MAHTTESIVGLMASASIAGNNVARCRKQYEHQPLLAQATLGLVGTCEETLLCAREAHTLALSDPSCSSESIAAFILLRERAVDLAAIFHSLDTATEDHIIAHMLSLADRSPAVKRLLLHFASEIESIVRNGLNSDADDDTKLCRIFETCYTNSLSEGRNLHVENHFIPLEEAALESPFDPDYESEQYYEHEDRLNLDPCYAEAHYKRQERERESRNVHQRETSQEWIMFWMQSMTGCIEGPTMFWTLPRQGGSDDFIVPPHYLFRAFDTKSSGRSEDRVVMSTAYKYASPGYEQQDLLSLERKDASRLLYSHLNKRCLGGDSTDNLMSWSSSLLFVIQYAIWRCRQSGRSPAEVKICAVDTTKFPRGQFARDLWLIGKCHDLSEGDRQMEKFVRLRKQFYDNGEYLSQGTLNHSCHSCVTSLQSLAQAGIYQLYPECDKGSGSWTKRVEELRAIWIVPQTTSHEDVDLAVKIEGLCFHDLDTVHLAIVLLSFRARQIRCMPVKGVRLLREECTIAEPEEVRRSVKALEAIKMRNGANVPSMLRSSLHGVQLEEHYVIM
ncbi:hypothetical protein LTR35_011705 [Friedmanniomyces endolithicus]|nr:hypothetical protein LTS00_017695 [Friedmanniomyces endolithicus]KAK0274196.1 hypothetical protein LTR35_011705 [Friedmanniomyces endolithicus]KAK0983582.1 hypothetical protein LTR54_014247 [Friedmanniomyces endolithicus]